jgi:hypothetical protein
MSIKSTHKLLTSRLLVGALGTVGLSAIALFGAAQSASALTVVKGSDYWTTQEGSSYDFGGSIGKVNFLGRRLGNWTPPDPEDADPINVGLADTIVRRLDDVTFNTDAQDGESGVSNVEVVALSLRSQAPVNLGGSSYDILVDLNTAKKSEGNITINENGTFSSDFTVHWTPTFRPVSGAGDLSCTDVFTSGECDSDLFSINLSASAGNWSSEFPGGLKVEGLVGDINANFHTNLSAIQKDFFTVGIVDHDASGAGHHFVAHAEVPEPLTILGSVTAMGFGTFFKRKLGKKLQQEKA